MESRARVREVEGMKGGRWRNLESASLRENPCIIELDDNLVGSLQLVLKVHHNNLTQGQSQNLDGPQ